LSLHHIQGLIWRNFTKASYILNLLANLLSLKPMLKKILIFNLLFVLVFQPVAATLLVPASITDQAEAGDLITQSKHCPDKTAPDCADMQGCIAFGHFSCDSKVTSLLFVSLFDAAILLDILPAQLGNHYSLAPQGPPLRPPRYS
jgi:hypothetical protein